MATAFTTLSPPRVPCGSVYAFLTRLRPHKRKPRGDTEIKEGAGKTRVYRGDKRMSAEE